MVCGPSIPFAFFGLLVAAVAPAYCQTRTFDISTFTPPQGWESEQRATVIAFKHIDNAKGVFCQLLVHSSQPSTGNPTADFAREWKEVILNAFSGTEPQPAPGRSAAGISFMQGGATVEQGSHKYWAHLFAFAAPPKVVSVVVLATNPQTIGNIYASVVHTFLDSMRFAPAAEPLPAKSAGSPTAPDPGKFRGVVVSGVWMGFKQLTMIGSVEPDARWITFFDDGESMDTIPRQGLAGFDRRASKTDPQEGPYWSTYRFSAGSGVINTRTPTKFRAETPDKIKVDDLWYYNRCASVDGLRLQGSWTSYADPNDPVLQRLPAGQRPIFRFTRDGRFIDEGVFIAFLGSFGNRPDELAGSGTYEVRDFSLMLHYSDGRQKQVAFTGFMSNNPASNDQMLYIGRGLFRKMK